MFQFSPLERADPVSLSADLFRAPRYKLKDRLFHIGAVDVTAIRALLAQDGERLVSEFPRQKQFAVHGHRELGFEISTRSITTRRSARSSSLTTRAFAW
jgi:hypothetical protein